MRHLKRRINRVFNHLGQVREFCALDNTREFYAVENAREKSGNWAKNSEVSQKKIKFD